MIYLDYQPPFDLPTLTIGVHDGKLSVLYWQSPLTHRKFGSDLPNYLSFNDLNPKNPDHALIHQVICELDEYFAGVRVGFDVPLDLSQGTPFQRQVWQALCQIPYGKTISYKQLATMIGRPTAFRACANANGKNPISLIVPCHRVIASDGTIGGYTGGLAIKQTLLAVERA